MDDFQIVDTVTNQTSGDGVAISPAGVKSYFDNISKNAISGSFNNGTLSLASTNNNFTKDGDELVIKNAGTYDINVTANIFVRSSSGDRGDIFTCGYTVGSAEYPVASITINGSYGSGSTNGNDIKSVYCSPGTKLGYYTANKIGGFGSARVDYTMTLSFSIKQVVN